MCSLALFYTHMCSVGKHMSMLCVALCASDKFLTKGGNPWNFEKSRYTLASRDLNAFGLQCNLIIVKGLR